MSRWTGPLATAIVLTAVVHVATVIAIPSAIMRVVLRGAAEKTGGPNHFLHSPRTTPQSQTVVRPSPDLAYSACSINVSGGAVNVVVNRAVAPAVVALYGENTDTIWSAGSLLTAAGETRDKSPLRLLIAGAQAPVTATGPTVVRISSRRALLLVRRLAPTAGAFAAIDAERQKDVCMTTAPKVG
ncbi:DUF1254 domain-containing protein [Sphingomonas sp. 28-62-11]|uniref:DUF1254 domain-containing protein n=1 Tax=Sphingomonas sp. 28-62-11 TaxID=1970432 RepID=UPI000BCF1B6F|nr:MAG: hypothetical protein B7Y49_12040 [Sphingomonas sp. 28-62-11]